MVHSLVMSMASSIRWCVLVLISAAALCKHHHFCVRGPSRHLTQSQHHRGRNTRSHTTSSGEMPGPVRRGDDTRIGVCVCVCTYDTNRPLSIVICLSFGCISCVCWGLIRQKSSFSPLLPVSFLSGERCCP